MENAHIVLDGVISSISWVETVFDQVMMAIERGKRADLIFGDPGKLSHRVLGRILGAVENSAPIKA